MKKASSCGSVSGSSPDSRHRSSEPPFLLNSTVLRNPSPNKKFPSKVQTPAPKVSIFSSGGRPPAAPDPFEAANKRAAETPAR